MRWSDVRTLVVVALSIATLVFHPLTNALSIDHGYWLHWRTQDTEETVGAWLGLALLILASVALPAKGGRWKVVETLLAVWVLIGFFFLAAGLVKASLVRDFATNHREAARWLGVLPVVVLGALLLRTLRQVSSAPERPFERIALVCSPLTLVFAVQLAEAQHHHREPPAPKRPTGTPLEASSIQHPVRVRTLILLFDELSPDFLYGSEAGVVPGRLPALERLVNESTRYTRAFLSGGKTALAIPALFGARRASDPGAGASLPEASDGPPPTNRQVETGWLHRAVESGLDTRVFGWHLDYCADIAVTATRCKAVSLYNPRTLDARFSFLNPLWTVLNLLPYEAPFGFAKSGPAVRMHAATLAAAGAWMHEQLSTKEADVVYVHVGVPHVPFLADALGSDQRFTPERQRYVVQLRQVDAFVDKVLRRKDGPETRIIVLSDHNVRGLSPAFDPQRVVFLVREPHPAGAAERSEPVDAVDLLSSLVGGERSGGS